MALLSQLPASCDLGIGATGGSERQVTARDFGAIGADAKPFEPQYSHQADIGTPLTSS